MISKLLAAVTGDATRQPWNQPDDPRYSRTYSFVGALIILAVAIGTGLALSVDWLTSLAK